MPKSRVEFWSEKLNGNKTRDERNFATLTQAGWQVHVVWECELNDREVLEEKLRGFLGSAAAPLIP
ncbi:hypothetical protein [Duganella sp. BuS-21]|uniref:hypothetical protein n=1 Tax=Duganella sp. BuS-21 TaxID=2943848 RepID=UPI0035A64BEE